MDVLTKLFTSGARAWQNLAPGQKALAAFVGVGVIALFAFYVNWARTPDFATAFTDLNEADAASVVAKLKEANIPYRISPTGRSILVPSKQAQDVRLQMASAGLPNSGSIGFEIFDKTNFGLTEQAQKINYQRALEGELARTIGRLETVQQARIHLVIPQQSLFSEKEKQPTVSVFLTVKPGRQISQSQVKGIVSLVTKSVEGLEAKNVTVVDNSGKILSEQLGEDGADTVQASSNRLEAQQRYEDKMEQNVHTMLEKLVGANRVAVRINAVLNWDQIESQTESYSPKEGEAPVRTSHEQTEISSQQPLDTANKPAAQAATSNGTPGVPVYQNLNAVATPGYYQNTDVTKNYELSKTVEHIVKSPGSIKNLSVAVAVDSAQVADEAQIKTIKDLVTAASGADASRGDMITVTSFPFKDIAAVETPAPLPVPSAIDKYLNYAKTLAAVAGPVLLLLILRSMLNRSMKRYALPQPAVSAQAAAIAPLPLRPQLIQPDPQKQIVRQQVESLARQQPAMLGHLINTWIEEEKRS
ncbi:MAG: flagellar M-ring protein FliF [Chloroflexi bacterium]|nr:flagellar M-ring protein FliF [Chloroflexota bacterium]